MNRMILLALCLLLLSGCGGPKVREIDAATDPAEDADFSSADYFKITDVMMTSIEANGFFDRYRSEHGGEKPVLLLAKSLQNNTDEHIDTRLILEKIRTAMIKEGIADFVDDQAFDMALDQLNLQATDLYDNSKAAKIGRFVGAKYVLRGTISNLRKTEGREDINYMNVTLDIFEVETLLIKWTDEVDIKRASSKGMFR
jgi:uncharacterized protein (TIGR02722 family)